MGFNRETAMELDLVELALLVAMMVTESFGGSDWGAR
jgi:hypothetical protein